MCGVAAGLGGQTDTWQQCDEQGEALGMLAQPAPDQHAHTPQHCSQAGPPSYLSACDPEACLLPCSSQVRQPVLAQVGVAAGGQVAHMDLHAQHSTAQDSTAQHVGSCNACPQPQQIHSTAGDQPTLQHEVRGGASLYISFQHPMRSQNTEQHVLNGWATHPT